ncbi:MAG: transferrin-binding protein-like solute binding protein [Planktotalea sp.]|uniref:transferrin-binding protein-like solute binding protein n=1 Tax=Planktotalea sp. TaxID=2029877 RepID=UPI0026085525|nr:transferrin-binding protein-like solute binding protein [Planktotalea sp.]MDG1075207.1 transferrin-binding protein-like solute binding protein [Planktotalea sp.]
MSLKFSVVLLLVCPSACASNEGITPEDNLPNDRGDTDREATPPEQTVPNLPSYEPLIGSSSNTISQLRGATVTARTGNAQLRNATGRVRHNGGKLVIDDGLYKLADENGFDANGEAENEGVTLRLVNPNGQYEYASLYSTSYTVDADTYTAVGAIGIATRDEDMPTTGLASYSGDSVYAYTTQTGTGFAGVGTFSADVDFEGRQMQGYMEVRTAQNPFTQETVANPAFDRIDMDRFIISGTSFSGTDMRPSNNGTEVAITGANTTAQVEGQFYGIVRTSENALQPDEIAGEALLIGDDGNIILSFIAD